MHPYRILEETDEHTVYEFRTYLLYGLYGSLAMMLAGMATGNVWLDRIGFGLILLYLVMVSIPSWFLLRKFRVAMRRGSIELSGSKWSFTNPLRVKIKKADLASRASGD